MTCRRVAWSCLVILCMGLWLSGTIVAEGPAAPVTNVDDSFRTLCFLLAWLLPLGISLIAVGQGTPSRLSEIATALPLALVIAFIGYYLCGFALQFGGIGLITQIPGLESLRTEWFPLEAYLGLGWGLAGLQGFALQAVPEQAISLFLAQLPLVTTATLIPLLTLRGHTPRLPNLLLAALVSCAVYPLVGNWVQGGGWLMQLGSTRGLGKGFLDYGLSVPHLVGSLAAFIGLIAFRQRGQRPLPTHAPALPPGYLPLTALTGAFLSLVGWLALLIAHPLMVWPSDPNRLVLQALLAVTGSIIGTFCYAWLVRGHLDPGLTSRGILAAIVAIGPGLPFVPFAATVLVGVACGILLAPAMYLIEHVLHLADRSAAISVHAMSALCGLVVVGFLVGSRALARASGPTAGLGYPSAVTLQYPQQLYAQLAGIGAILVVAGVLPGLLMMLLAQAYLLPPSVLEKAHQRALQARQAREARERRKCQGLSRRRLSRLYAAYLAIVAASPLRLSRHPLRLSPNHPRSQGTASRHHLQ